MGIRLPIIWQLVPIDLPDIFSTQLPDYLLTGNNSCGIIIVALHQTYYVEIIYLAHLKINIKIITDANEITGIVCGRILAGSCHQ
jgi:hypothetical protein